MTVQNDDFDTTTSIETLIEGAQQVETERPNGRGIEEVVGDKGYHRKQFARRPRSRRRPQLHL